MKPKYRSYKQTLSQYFSGLINYKPVSILPKISKLLKRSLLKEIFSFFDTVFPNVSMWISKLFKPQHCFVTTNENWKPNIDTGKASGILLIGFACFLHELLMPNLKLAGSARALSTF